MCVKIETRGYASYGLMREISLRENIYVYSILLGATRPELQERATWDLKFLPPIHTDSIRALLLPKMYLLSSGALPPPPPPTTHTLHNMCVTHSHLMDLWLS